MSLPASCPRKSLPGSLEPGLTLFYDITNRLEKESGRLLPGWPGERSDSAGLTEPTAERFIVCQSFERAGQALDIARRHQQPFPLMFGQIGKVPGLPADDREPERHRLAVDRAIGLFDAR